MSKIRVAAGPTPERERQEFRAKHEQRPITACGQPAYYFIDGQLLCRAHAGKLALDKLGIKTIDRSRFRPPR